MWSRSDRFVRGMLTERKERIEVLPRPADKFCFLFRNPNTWVGMFLCVPLRSFAVKALYPRQLAANVMVGPGPERPVGTRRKWPGCRESMRPKCW